MCQRRQKSRTETARYERVCRRRGPGLGRAQDALLRLMEQRIRRHRQRVRQRDLLGDADQEQHETARQVLPHLRPPRIGIELVDDLVMPHQRPGNQLREEGDEHAEVEEAVDMPVTAAQVDQVGDLLEDEEADAQRQDQ
jgi:hypothetical protein